MGESGCFDVSPGIGVKDRKLFATAERLIAFFKTLPSTVQKNGVWVVMTDPAAYGESDLKQLAKLEELCKKGKIPFFLARAKDLPNGWQRKS